MTFYHIFWTVDSWATRLSLMIHNLKPECPVKKIELLHSQSRSQRRAKCLCLSRWYLPHHPTFCFQTWHYDASLWAGVSCRKIYLLFSRSRSLQELIWSKYDHFYCIFWTADPFATKLGLIVHYHKPECFTEILDCYVQNVNECLSKWCLLHHQTFCFQLWYCDASLWVGVSCQKIYLLFSRSRSLQELIWSYYDNFCCIF